VAVHKASAAHKRSFRVFRSKVAVHKASAAHKRSFCVFRSKVAVHNASAAHKRSFRVFRSKVAVHKASEAHKRGEAERGISHGPGSPYRPGNPPPTSQAGSSTTGSTRQEVCTSHVIQCNDFFRVDCLVMKCMLYIVIR
jgi:hypothetical protein